MNAPSSAPSADAAFTSSVRRASWHRRWRLGEVFVAVGELDGRHCCLESLPENALVERVPARPAGCGLAEVRAAWGARALYVGLPGRHRLADLVVDPGSEADRVIAAAGAAGRQLARLHAVAPAAGAGVPPYLALIRAELDTDALAMCRDALTASPVREHLGPLTDPAPFWSGGALLHGNAGPGAFFVGPGARPTVAMARWTGLVGGDPLYDLGTLLGPLVELTREQSTVAVAPRFVARVAHAALTGYVAGRGRAMSPVERDSLWSRIVLNLVLHLCYFTVRSGYRADPRPYIDGIAAVAGAGGDVLDGVFEAAEVDP